MKRNEKGLEEGRPVTIEIIQFIGLTNFEFTMCQILGQMLKTQR